MPEVRAFDTDLLAHWEKSVRKQSSFPINHVIRKINIINIYY